MPEARLGIEFAAVSDSKRKSRMTITRRVGSRDAGSSDSVRVRSQLQEYSQVLIPLKLRPTQGTRWIRQKPIWLPSPEKSPSKNTSRSLEPSMAVKRRYPRPNLDSSSKTWEAGASRKWIEVVWNSASSRTPDLGSSRPFPILQKLSPHRGD